MIGMTMIEQPSKSQFHDEMEELLRHIQADPVVMNTLKGHLIIEEKMTAGIERFLWHGEFVDDLRLSFAKKLVLCRSMSITDENHSMWDVISKLNTLRNTLAHSLDGERRNKAFAELRGAYMHELNGLPLNEIEKTDEGLILCIVSTTLGFLKGFFNEVDKTRSFLDRFHKLIHAVDVPKESVAERKPTKETT